MGLCAACPGGAADQHGLICAQVADIDLVFFVAEIPVVAGEKPPVRRQRSAPAVSGFLDCAPPISVVVLRRRSRTKTFRYRWGVPGARFSASDAKATTCPSSETEGRWEPPPSPRLPWGPAARLTRTARRRRRSRRRAARHLTPVVHTRRPRTAQCARSRSRTALRRPDRPRQSRQCRRARPRPPTRLTASRPRPPPRQLLHAGPE